MKNSNNNCLFCIKHEILKNKYKERTKNYKVLQNVKMKII